MHLVGHYYANNVNILLRLLTEYILLNK